MAKNKSKSAARSAIDLTHGGQRIAPAAMRRALETVRSSSPNIDTEKLKLLRLADKFQNKLRTPPSAQNAAEAFDGLNRIASRVAKRKVVAPALATSIGGILAGSYSLRLTPGYDFGSINAFPNDSRNRASVTRNNGTMGFSVFSDSRDQDAVAAISLGAFFIPLFGPASLRASINPSFAFAFSAVSNGVSATTLALMNFRVSVFNPDGSLDLNVPTTASGTKLLWFKQLGVGLEFDWGTESDNPMNASVDVDTRHFYLLQLECIGQAFSSARDDKFRANASGILNLTLPFIDLDLRMIPVLTAD